MKEIWKGLVGAFCLVLVFCLSAMGISPIMNSNPGGEITPELICSIFSKPKPVWVLSYNDPFRKSQPVQEITQEGICKIFLSAR